MRKYSVPLSFLFVLLNLLLLMPGHLAAQGNATISGKVIDQNTKAAVPFASVAVFTEKDELLTGNMAGEDGRFVIAGLDDGSYRLVVSFEDYGEYTTRVLIGKLNEHYDVGEIELESLAYTMDEVIATGERSGVADDLFKKSYYLNDTIAAAGGSIMDAMKAMPGITFDQEGKVTLRGSDKVIVLIDGKQSSLTGFGNQKGLDNIPATNIERIEIINNPSAKYDASGMAGVINIIYSKDKQ